MLPTYVYNIFLYSVYYTLSYLTHFYIFNAGRQMFDSFFAIWVQ